MGARIRGHAVGKALRKVIEVEGDVRKVQQLYNVLAHTHTTANSTHILLSNLRGKALAVKTFLISDMFLLCCVALAVYMNGLCEKEALATKLVVVDGRYAAVLTVYKCRSVN